jgi:ectoine hydroxylase-related dioxygenase (phytanoyl-CoA dioxygenase family)
LLRNVCSRKEIAFFREVIVRISSKLTEEKRPLAERDTYGKAFLQTMNLWQHDPEVRAFVFGRRFGHIAAQLMRVDGVRLFHDQALFKEAGGGHTPWHQDQGYWPMATENTVTMWMPLVDASREMGTMFFASESHKDGYFGHMEISDGSQASFSDFVKERGYRLTASADMKAGDATFHAGLTLHGAPPNMTDKMREVMTVIYYESGVGLMFPDNENRKNDLELFFPGQKPGDEAVSPLNPLIWHTSRKR